MTGYKPMRLSLNPSQYLKDEYINKIDGHRTVFQLMLDKVIGDAQTGYEVYAGDLTGHFGEENYNIPEGASIPDVYTENTAAAIAAIDAQIASLKVQKGQDPPFAVSRMLASPEYAKAIFHEEIDAKIKDLEAKKKPHSAMAEGGGELYRLTWASTYYNALQAAGFEKSNKPFWDKQMWDTDANNDGSTDEGAWSFSLYDGLRTVGSIAVGLATAGAGSLAFNAAMSLVHDTANLATGYMSWDEFGVNQLKNVINSGVSLITGGLGNGLDGIVASSAIGAVGDLATRGLRLNKEGKMDWSMSRDEFASWGMGSVMNLGTSMFTTGPLSAGNAVAGQFAGSAFGEVLGNTIGQGLNSFIRSAGSQLISGKEFDWSEVGRDSLGGAAQGLGQGLMARAMGGRYDGKAGGFTYQSASGAGLYYGKDLAQVSTFAGNIFKEGIDLSVGRTFDINLGGQMGMHFGGSHGFMMDNNASGLGFEDMVNAFGSMRYAGFQMDQLSKGDEGNTTIDLVNLGHYAGGHNTSEDVINGKKQIVYDLDEANGEYGHAGEDNMTIHLAKQAISSGNADGYDQKAAMYASTFVREGFLIDQWSSLESKTGLKSSGMSQDVRNYMEWQASIQQVGSLAALEGMGLSVKGNANYETIQAGLVYSALTGEAGMFDWSDGRSQQVAGKNQNPAYMNKNNAGIQQGLVDYLPHNKDKTSVAEPNAIGVGLADPNGSAAEGIGIASDLVNGLIQNLYRDKAIKHYSKGGYEIIPNISFGEFATGEYNTIVVKNKYFSWMYSKDEGTIKTPDGLYPNEGDQRMPYEINLDSGDIPYDPNVTPYALRGIQEGKTFVKAQGLKIIEMYKNANEYIQENGNKKYVSDLDLELLSKFMYNNTQKAFSELDKKKSIPTMTINQNSMKTDIWTKEYMKQHLPSWFYKSIPTEKQKMKSMYPK